MAQKEKDKCEKYSCLLLVTKKQYTQQKRKQAPTFAPFAIADNGELGPDATALQEWIVEHYRRKIVLEPKRLDGCSPQSLIRDFRRRLKVSVQQALASGFDASLNATGLPWQPY